ncbi:hypothetical protein P3X46_003521 [Hevea brasiliensis]|uniref:DUF8040 domain-containing protein n=1 Tax=Hevea brasiliensis TaxID=3981 RepID=A0ABQ9N875_HEVBR|nr:hypothetical protein P3X46_003521 [Hevea brasiliensis]
MFFLDMDIDVQINNNDKEEEALNALDDDDETWQLVIATAGAITEYFYKYIYKEPCMVSYQTGLKWLLEVLQSHQDCCVNIKYGLKSSRRMSVMEKVAIFLYTLALKASNRHARERFQHSGETISRVFRQVLNVICLMSMDIIKPIDYEFSDTPPEILNNRRYMPHFKDCIGTIDGTHVQASIAPGEQIPYIGRKGILTQNIMAACKKYYLVDAEYPNMKDYLKPYKDTRYHLPYFRRGQPLSGQEEIFNRAHSSLRIQMKIFIASMVLHNYIRKRARGDRVFQIFDSNPEYVPSTPWLMSKVFQLIVRETMNHRI